MVQFQSKRVTIPNIKRFHFRNGSEIVNKNSTISEKGQKSATKNGTISEKGQHFSTKVVPFQKIVKIHR